MHCLHPVCQVFHLLSHPQHSQGVLQGVQALNTYDSMHLQYDGIRWYLNAPKRHQHQLDCCKTCCLLAACCFPAKHARSVSSLCEGLQQLRLNTYKEMLRGRFRLPAAKQEDKGSKEICELQFEVPLWPQQDHSPHMLFAATKTPLDLKLLVQCAMLLRLWHCKLSTSCQTPVAHKHS